jgi:arginyl-tRNA synthetase
LLHSRIQHQLQSAVHTVLPDADVSQVLVRPCADRKFGDYQANALMNLAKTRKLNPRQLASDVVSRLDVGQICDPVEIAGAGFLNFRLRPDAIAGVLRQALAGGRLFFEGSHTPRTLVVDFSSPNVAKPMHVGHIRSTILGDSLARTLRLLGHNVITDNHIGDWGTQFGKLIVGWKRFLDADALKSDPLAEMERLYKKVNAATESDPLVLTEAREELVKLQSGDAENLAIWREMIGLSQAMFERIYRRLGTRFDHTYGESFYNPKLKGVVQELVDKKIARESEGAIAVFFDEIPELKEHPALIQKSDGAANYTTTDLATIAFRLENWRPDEIVYVTDARQQLHFRQFFAIFHRWHPEARVKLAHVWFGMILGPDGKPFKTRTGENIKLSELLDEAEERALAVVTEKNPDLSLEQRREIARLVGLGAIKYADLLPNRQSDYVFSWEKMLALNGNTAPYLQYAYTRIRSIFRKADPQSIREMADAPFKLQQAEELALAKHLLNFGIVLEAVIDEYRPNYLCNYLYELAGIFARFYEQCPVLKSEGMERADRLALCELTSRVLRSGLELLGIETPEQM